MTNHRNGPYVNKLNLIAVRSCPSLVRSAWLVCRQLSELWLFVPPLWFNFLSYVINFSLISWFFNLTELNPTATCQRNLNHFNCVARNVQKANWQFDLF